MFSPSFVFRVRVCAQCDTGFTGADCSQRCPCNEHSSCDLGPCDECQHNTEGEFCERCQQGFFGDAEQGTPQDCRPCVEACNGHTTACYPSLEAAGGQDVCIGCSPASHTQGSFCDECVAGYFKDPSSPPGSLRCIECPCGGRGDVCDAVTGTNCTCFAEEHAVTIDPTFQCASCEQGYVASGTNASTGFMRPGDACFKAVSMASPGAVGDAGDVELTPGGTPLRLAILPIPAGENRPFEHTVLQLQNLRGEVVVDILSEQAAAHQDCGVGVCRRSLCSEFSGSCVGLEPSSAAQPEWTVASGGGAATRGKRGTLSRSSSSSSSGHGAGAFEGGKGITSAERHDGDAMQALSEKRAKRTGGDEDEGSSGAELEVVLDCSAFNFLLERVFVSLRAGGGSGASASYALGYSGSSSGSVVTPDGEVQTLDALTCASCVSCSVPCVPGFFLNPQAPQGHLCRPCECNGHGDRCNVITGGSCGLASEGCDVVTGDNCQCAHNTVSMQTSVTQRTFEFQCNRCMDVVTSGSTEVSLTGEPDAGKQCYQRVSTQAVREPSLAPGEAQFFLFVPAAGNAFDMRLTVDVWQGTVTVLVATDNGTVVQLPSGETQGVNSGSTLTTPAASSAAAVAASSPSSSSSSSFDNGTLPCSSGSKSDGRGCISAALELGTGSVVPSNATFKRVVVDGHRLQLLLSQSQFDFASTVFYVTVVNSAVEGEALLRVFASQPIVAINLVVFFHVFFCVFFLFSTLILLAYKLHRYRRQRRSEREERMALETLSRRPNADTTLLLRRDAALDDGSGRANVRTRAFRRRRVHHTQEPVPVAVQALAGGRKDEAIAAFVIELPGDRQRGGGGVALGIAHTTSDKHAGDKKRKKGRRGQNHKRHARRGVAVNPAVEDTPL